MADPSLQCPGLFVEFEPGVGLCDRGDDCEALVYRNDFAAYRACHERKVSADVVMDPENEF